MPCDVNERNCVSCGNARQALSCVDIEIIYYKSARRRQGYVLREVILTYVSLDCAVSASFSSYSFS